MTSVRPRGFCKVRGMQGQECTLLDYGMFTTICVEPIEKKPFYHFHYGSKVLSVGSFGCSLFCDYCENSSITQSDNPEVSLINYSPSDLVAMAVLKGCQGVCMTYSEPIVLLEYLRDLSVECRSQGLYLALNTNGYCEVEPWQEICKLSDALNIDWKVGSDRKSLTGVSDYKSIISRNIFTACVESNLHVEVSIPIFEDTDLGKLMPYIKMLSMIDRYTPVHLLRIFPANRYGNRATSDDLVLNIAHKVSSLLDHVYVGNVFTDDALAYKQTYCPLCKSVVLERDFSGQILRHFESCKCS